MIETLLHVDPWANMLQKDVILWRHIPFESSGPRVEEMRFDPTDRSTVLGRVQLVGNTGCWEPCAMNNSYESHGHRNYVRGIALFVEGHPPANWTHLIITGVSKAFNDPGRQENGGAIFAKVAIPYQMDVYLDFRSRLFEAYRANINADIEKAVELSDSIRPDQGFEHNEKRLIIQPAWTNDAHFKYAFLPTKEVLSK